MCVSALCVACCLFSRADTASFVKNTVHNDVLPVDSIIKNAFPEDSLHSEIDSLVHSDSVTFNIPISKDTIDAPVVYTAKDSIVYDIEEKKVHLYGEATAKYKDITLNLRLYPIQLGHQHTHG